MDALILTLAVTCLAAEDPPQHAALTTPASQTAGWVSGGFGLVRIDVPSIPVFPVLTGGFEVHRGLSDALDLGLRTTVHLGWIYKVGPELRVRAFEAGPIAVGASVWPTVRFAGAFSEGLDLGGDLASRGALRSSLAGDRSAWTVEAGTSIQWLLFEHIQGESFVDDAPWWASWDIALEHSWRHRERDVLFARLELVVPRGPDSPVTVLGVVPRAVLGARLRGRSGG